jgi:hypothetical protein
MIESSGERIIEGGAENIFRTIPPNRVGVSYKALWGSRRPEIEETGNTT